MARRVAFGGGPAPAPGRPRATSGEGPGMGAGAGLLVRRGRARAPALVRPDGGRRAGRRAAGGRQARHAGNAGAQAPSPLPCTRPPAERAISRRAGPYPRTGCACIHSRRGERGRPCAGLPPGRAACHARRDRAPGWHWTGAPCDRALVAPGAGRGRAADRIA